MQREAESSRDKWGQSGIIYLFIIEFPLGSIKYLTPSLICLFILN